MNKTKTIILLTTALLLCSSFVLMANACVYEGYTYDLTNSAGDHPVQLDASVTVTATTNNWAVDKVRFTWINPAGQAVFNETKSVHYSSGMYTASSTYAPDSLGNWTVKAEFLDKQCCCCYAYYKTVATRTTSFNVVPEVPLIGTAGIAVAMGLGLLFYKKRTPQ